MNKILLSVTLLCLSAPLFCQQKNLDEKSDTEPHTFVDQMPEFPGGEGELMRFIANNVEYPRFAIENDIQGKVITTFVICEDGSLCEFNVLNDPDSSLIIASYNMLSKMPNWKPGEQEGTPVRVIFNLPINFELAAPESKAEKKARKRKKRRRRR